MNGLTLKFSKINKLISLKNLSLKFIVIAVQINVIYYCQILFPLDFKNILNYHHITIADLINKVSGTRKHY